MMKQIEKEITDGMKHDLGLVVCDHKFCGERGDWTNCFMSERYRDCVHYKNLTKYKEETHGR